MKNFEGRKKDCLKALEAIRVEQEPGGECDVEVDHANADEVLLVCIGSSKVRRAFKEIEKWYA